MRNIVLTFEKPQLKINDEVFEVLRSDAAIIQDLLDIGDAFAGKNLKDPRVSLEQNKAMLDYLDKLLGPGAQERILASIPGMEGYDLGLAGVGNLLTQISQMASKAYADAITAKYEDD